MTIALKETFGHKIDLTIALAIFFWKLIDLTIALRKNVGRQINRLNNWLDLKISLTPMPTAGGNVTSLLLFGFLLGLAAAAQH